MTTATLAVNLDALVLKSTITLAFSGLDWFVCVDTHTGETIRAMDYTDLSAIQTRDHGLASNYVTDVTAVEGIGHGLVSDEVLYGVTVTMPMPGVTLTMPTEGVEVRLPTPGITITMSQPGVTLTMGVLSDDLWLLEDESGHWQFEDDTLMAWV